MNTFQDIIAWQKGYQLTLLIYKFTKGFPPNEEFGLKSQIRRAAVSIVSNIAEGFRKYSLKEGIHYYNCSLSSLEEVKCQNLLSRDLGYYDLKSFEAIQHLSDECGKTLNAWIKSQKILMNRNTYK